MKHKNSPLRDVLSGIGNLLQSVAEDHACFENDIKSSLGPDKTIYNLITKDYPNMQKDKDSLRKKQKEQDNIESRYNKVKQTRELALDDDAFETRAYLGTPFPVSWAIICIVSLENYDRLLNSK